MKQPPTKQLKDFMQGKIKKVPGLSNIIQQQQEFIEQVNLTRIFLLIYKGNPEEFKFLIGEDVWEYYEFDKGLENPEWMWECIDEMTCDIVCKNKNFKITGNGLFSTLHFSKNNNKKFKENLNYMIKNYGSGEWHI